MSLVKCPECGKQVSETAKACPNCGHVLKQKDGGTAMTLGIISVILGFILGISSADQALLVKAHNIMSSSSMPDPIGTILATPLVLVGIVLIVIGVVRKISYKKNHR